MFLIPSPKIKFRFQVVCAIYHNAHWILIYHGELVMVKIVQLTHPEEILDRYIKDGRPSALGRRLLLIPVGHVLNSSR